VAAPRSPGRTRSEKGDPEIGPPPATVLSAVTSSVYTPARVTRYEMVYVPSELSADVNLVWGDCLEFRVRGEEVWVCG